MARYLVTGGAGFIGSHLAHALVARGERVRVLDDLSTGYLENLAEIQDQIEFVEGDITDRATVERAMREVDFVHHHAALASVPRSVEDPWLNHRINVDGTLELLMAAREARVRRFVLASSAAIYGENEKTPKREGMPPEPLSPYAAAKLIDENYCAQFTAAGWVPCVALRYFNIFGPWQDPASDYAAVVPIFVHKLLEGERPMIHGDGGQTRDFTFVENVVHANLLASEKESAIGGVFNIGCGGSYSVLDLFRRVAEALQPGAEPVHGPERAGDVRKSEACIDEARDRLGYSPIVGFEDGLARTCEWFRANPDRARRKATT